MEIHFLISQEIKLIKREKKQNGILATVKPQEYPQD